MLTWAVHISANVLTVPWAAGGFAGMAALIGLGLWRLRDDEIPRIALLTAAYFIASSIHVPLGPTSAHLLLNGLVGVMLGRRAGLAIAIGLLFQAVLLGHGDLSTWGINCCVSTLPALLAAPLYRNLANAERTGLPEASLAVSWLLYPWSLVVVGPVLVMLRRMRWTAESAGGFLVGFGVVMGTAMLNGAVLAAGGAADWRIFAVLIPAVHLPVAIVEGLVLSVLVGLIARVKPEILQERGSG